MEAQSTDDIFLVPVPRSALAAVYALLAQNLSGEISSSETATDSFPLGTDEAKEDWWTPERLLRLRRDISRYPAAETIMSLTSTFPGDPIPIKEVEKSANLVQRQVAGQLAAFTKYCKSRLGRAEWPFRAVWLTGEGKASYVMSPTVADRWKAVNRVLEPEVTESR